MKNNKSVTLQQVAKLAEVSVATVSRVINHPEQTSAHIKQKVFCAIEELKYNTTARSKAYLKTSLKKRILIIDNQVLPRDLVNKGLEDAAQRAKYQLFYLRFLFFTNDEIEQIITSVIHYHIDGIIIINDAPYLNKLKQYQQELPPILLLNHYSQHLSCLYFDHLTVGFEATQYLLERGHTRIACFIGLSNKKCMQQLLKGYQLACNRYSVSINNDYIKTDCVHSESIKNAVTRLLKLPNPPSALFCHNSISLSYLSDEILPPTSEEECMAYIDENILVKTILWYARKKHYHIPRDLSLITTTSQPSNDIAPNHTITHIQMPMYKMGQKGFHILISKINCQNKQYQSVLIDSTLVERHSVIAKNLNA